MRKYVRLLGVLLSLLLIEQQGSADPRIKPYDWEHGHPMFEAMTGAWKSVCVKQEGPTWATYIIRILRHVPGQLHKGVMNRGVYGRQGCKNLLYTQRWHFEVIPKMGIASSHLEVFIDATSKMHVRPASIEGVASLATLNYCPNTDWQVEKIVETSLNCTFAPHPKNYELFQFRYYARQYLNWGRAPYPSTHTSKPDWLDYTMPFIRITK